MGRPLRDQGHHVAPRGQAMSNGQGVSGSLGEWQPGAATGLRRSYQQPQPPLSSSIPGPVTPNPSHLWDSLNAQATPLCPAQPPLHLPLLRNPPRSVEASQAQPPPKPSAHPTALGPDPTQKLVVGVGKVQSRPQALPCQDPRTHPRTPEPSLDQPPLPRCQRLSGALWSSASGGRVSAGGRHSTGPLGCWPAEACIQ